MPVKFRCSQCSQLLGISKRKIGASVSCPKCHHPMVVPAADMAASVVGSKVSRIFEHSDFDKLIAKRAAANGGDVASERLESVALLEEVELPELPAPPSRRTIQPTESAAAQGRFTANDAAGSLAAELRGTSPNAVSEAPAARTIKPELAKAPTANAGVDLADDARLSVEWLAVAGIVVAFVSGLAIGRYVVPITAAAARPESRLDPGAAKTAVEPVQPADLRQPVLSAATLSGALRVKIDGELKPDVGAVALIFPVDKAPEIKPSPDALRPQGIDDGGESKNRLRQANAAYAVADALGNVTATDLNPGDYWILYLSNNQRRELSQPVPVDERAAIAQFFGQVDQLLKDRAFLLVRRKLSPGEDARLSHTFSSN